MIQYRYYGTKSHNQLCEICDKHESKNNRRLNVNEHKLTWLYVELIEPLAFVEPNCWTAPLMSKMLRTTWTWKYRTINITST